MNTGEGLIGAVDEISSATKVANAAMAAQEADADTLADRPTRDAFAECVDLADHFMARHAGEGQAGNESLDSEGVCMADATGFDADAHLARRWFWNGSLHQFKFLGCCHLD